MGYTTREQSLLILLIILVLLIKNERYVHSCVHFDNVCRQKYEFFFNNRTLRADNEKNN